MSFTAAGHRHLRTLWKSKTVAWHWTALNLGHAQPNQHGRWCYRVARIRMWQFHLTPLHLSRDGDKRYFGLCFGKRTIYVMRHR